MTQLRTKAKIISIGNSQGLRIPKPLLEQSGLGQNVELEIDRNRIIIHSADRPRQGWEDAFRAMSERGDDQLLDEDLTGRSAWDENEWEW